MGDPAFFELLRSWGSQEPGTVTTEDFIRVAAADAQVLADRASARGEAKLRK